MKRPFGLLIGALLLTLSLSYVPTAYATHDDFVVGGTDFAAPAHAFQIYALDGTLRVSRFVLNSDSTEVVFQHDLDAGTGTEHERILVCGIETTGLARGPIFQIWDRDGNLLVTRLALNSDITEMLCAGFDSTGDGADEVVIWGLETTGAARGWILQIYDQTGALLLTKILLNPNFTSELFIGGNPRQPPIPLPVEP